MERLGRATAPQLVPPDKMMEVQFNIAATILRQRAPNRRFIMNKPEPLVITDGCFAAISGSLRSAGIPAEIPV
jgi:hypothetical protein